MPRRARMYISGLPYHVVQRGNNREACFFDSENYQYYLELLRDMLRRYVAPICCADMKCSCMRMC